MAEDLQHGHMTTLCDELILQILYRLNGKSILRLSRTCRRLYRICTFDQQLWSRLCYLDFEIKLPSPEPFNSFLHLYKLLFQSREVLRVYISGNYPVSENCRYGVFPSWLWTWVVLNTNPPYLPSWIRNYHEPFLKYKLSEISQGKVLRIWNLKLSELPGNLVTRVEYGTSYYRWSDIQVCAMRAHGGAKGLEKFMLKRCARSRGYVERAYERLYVPCVLARPSQSGRRDESEQSTGSGVSANGMGTSASASTSGLGSSVSASVSGLGNSLNVSFRTVRLNNGSGASGSGLVALISGLGNSAGASVSGLGNNVGASVSGLGNSVEVSFSGLGNRAGASVSGVLVGNSSGASASGLGNSSGASTSGLGNGDGASDSGLDTGSEASGSGLGNSPEASESGQGNRHDVIVVDSDSSIEL